MRRSWCCAHIALAVRVTALRASRSRLIMEEFQNGGDHSMRTMEGYVTLVQESRFQMIDDGGIAQLFVLSHAAAAEPHQLVPLQQRQARVRVRYSDASNLIAKTAHRIDVLDTAS